MPILPVDRLLAPFREFARINASSGVLLMAAAAIALLWANSPTPASYEQLWATKITIDVGGLTLSESLLHWVYDGPMAIFFLVVGLEIKREVLVGELASVQRATLPIAVAVGGAIIPVLIFVAVASAGSGIAGRGWGVPMATDIAFALGVLALLGRHPRASRLIPAIMAM